MELDKKQKVINFTVTFIQYVGFAIFLFWSPLVAKGIFWQIVELMGFALAIWAIVVMQKGKINIAPKPRKNAVLIKSGPYAIIRHPMYTSIIIAVSPLIITHWDIYRFAFLMFLYANLIVKLLFEETLLEKYFEGYSSYKKNSWRIIPYIF
jgi:protein-S-isoprenylcysteine O-methyltransferase Ste14